MKSRHYLRPVFLALGLIIVLLIVRFFLTPPDFGIHGRNFTYGFFRLSNIDEWKAFTVKYKGQQTCALNVIQKTTKNTKSPNTA